MPAQIGVAILHGIGSQGPDFADPFIDLLSRSLAERDIADGAFAFEPVHWAGVLSEDEVQLSARMLQGGPLQWPGVRAFVIESLADAVAYRRGYPKQWDAYHAIHWEVFSALCRLRDKLADPRAPLILLAHSLGSVIASDHIWDEQKREGFGRDAFTRCETVAGIITFGSNIPLFTLGLREIRCIQFPPVGNCLSDALRGAARWRNYYDRDDVLGYPLRSLSASYSATVEEDREMNAGTALTSWNPLSHNGYWAEPSFVSAVCEQLASVHLVYAAAAR